MINVGIVGVGFMGMVHYLSYQKARGVRFAALCEAQHTHRLEGDWTDIKGNFGPPGEKMNLSGVTTHTDVAEMLADDRLDLIDVCLPPGSHAPVTIQALRAGKHVFCEKPMALTTAECGRMAAAAEKAGKQLFIGHVLPFNVEFDYIYKAAASGKWGRLLGGSFKRVISEPKWLPHFFDAQRVGGPMLDLHIHDAHLIRLLFGMPTGVVSQGRLRGDLVEYFNTLFRFEDPDLVVTATCGVIGQQGRSFTHAFEVHFEKATVAFDFAVIGDQGRTLLPVTVLTHTGRVLEPKLGPSDPMNAFAAEIKEVVRCVNEDRPSEILSAGLARDAIVMCHKQTESVRKGRAVKI